MNQIVFSETAPRAPRRTTPRRASRGRCRKRFLDGSPRARGARHLRGRARGAGSSSRACRYRVARRPPRCASATSPSAARRLAHRPVRARTTRSCFQARYTLLSGMTCRRRPDLPPPAAARDRVREVRLRVVRGRRASCARSTAGPRRSSCSSSPDFEADARAVVASLAAEGACEETGPPPELGRRLARPRRRGLTRLLRPSAAGRGDRRGAGRATK